MAGPKTTGGGWGAPGSRIPPREPNGGWAGQQPTQDLNVIEMVSLVPPRLVLNDLPMTPAVNRTVVESRETIRQILRGVDGRMLVVVGPCSIHDENAALEYAGRLRALAQRVAERLFIVMRVYFEKPRTTVGWKGLIYDPHLDDSCDIENGLRTARRILLAITSTGLPTATEMLDPIVPQYIADLIAWSAIGARTTESQTHRQMASGLSMPVGYKNSTEGILQIAIDAMRSAHSPHHFIGIDEEGRTAIVKTRGNPWGHMILRGGRTKPNYDAASVALAKEALRKAGLPPLIMVDCSHANSEKKFQNQRKVLTSVVQQRTEGNQSLIGLLVESNLFEGSQPFQANLDKLRYGVSVTDECIGWEETEELILHTHAALGGKNS